MGDQAVAEDLVEDVFFRIWERRVEWGGAGDGPTATSITVDPGTTTLRVGATPTGDTTADVDLYLYDCTGERCFLVRRPTAVSGSSWLR